MKLGLVGAGLMGKRRARAMKELRGTELAIVADTDLLRARAIADDAGCEATTNWQEVVAQEDIEAVIVATPNKLLAPISIAAMQHGKHVLCEKPMATNPEEAKHMVEVANASKVKLKVGFSLHYHPAITRARELVDKGTIGELDFIRCRYGHGGRPNYDKEWRANPEISGGGELIDQGVHALDLFRWFVGDFREVIGFTTTRFWDAAQVEDNVFALLRTEKGQIASLHASWTQWKNIFSFEIFGHEGYIIVEGLGGNYGEEHLILGIRSPISLPPHEERFQFPGQDRCWYEELKEFVTALQENREPLPSGYDGWQLMRLVSAIYESAQKGCVVRM